MLWIHIRETLQKWNIETLIDRFAGER